MMDQATIEARARMACRVYLALFDAGDFGTPIHPGLALGPQESTQAVRQIADVLVCDLVEIDIFRKEMVINDEQHYALPDWMRTRMDGQSKDCAVHAERLRRDLRAYDEGKPIPARDFGEHEVRIRAGDPLAKAL